MGTTKETEIRVLTLEYQFDGSSTLFRLRQGWSLFFKLGPTLLGRSIKLYTNYPIQDEESFDRLGYTELEWEYEGSNINDDTSKFCKILLAQGGSFHYYLADSR